MTTTMHKIYFILAMMAAVTLVSCDTEDALTPSNIDTDIFNTKEGATDEESVLRNDFFKTTGSYLLFNDTLSNGELLDIGYVMTSMENNDVYVYDYLSTIEEKEKAVNFVQNYILPHLGEKLRPFSFLLVNNITHYNKNGKEYYQNYDDSDNPTSVVGVRATALAMGSIAYMEEDELQMYSKNVLKGILTYIISKQTSDTYKQFYNYGKDYYKEYIDVSWDIPEEENLKIMNEKGFICSHYAYGMLFPGYYPTDTEDVAAYIDLVMNSTAEEVEETYRSYPDIISKYQIMAKLMKELGYVE